MEPPSWAQSHSPHCSGEGLVKRQHKSSKNQSTLSAFLREGRSIACPAAVGNANPKGSTGRRVCENGPISCSQEPFPTRHTGQTCLEKLRVSPQADGKDALMTTKGTIPVTGEFSSPPLWSLCRELGGGREVETAAAASPHRDREALKKVQHIQTPLKSYLKIHFNQQVWGPSGCWKLRRCKCFSSLTTQPYFDTR